MRKRPIHVLNALLTLGLWVFVVAAYTRLPERIPQHIGLGGEVTRWASRESGMWFLTPILMTTHLLILYALGLGMTSASGINVPGKRRLAGLPRAAQAWAFEPARAFMFVMGTWLIVLSGTVQALIYVAAVGAAGLRAWLLPLLIVLSIAPLGGVWWLSRAVGRRIDEVEAALARDAEP